jgi:hypothetical protein
MNTVKFLDDKGQSFFDCNSAEARVAIDAVKEYRTVGGNRQQVMAKAADEMLKDTSCVVRESNSSILYSMTNVFSDIEEENLRVTHVVMHAKAYAIFRKMDRDVLDIETKSSNMKGGLFAHIWGAGLYCRSNAPEGIICVAHVDDSGKVIKQLRTKYNENRNRLSAITDLFETLETMKKHVKIIAEN